MVQTLKVIVIQVTSFNPDMLLDKLGGYGWYSSLYKNDYSPSTSMKLKSLAKSALVAGLSSLRVSTDQKGSTHSVHSVWAPRRGGAPSTPQADLQATHTYQGLDGQTSNKSCGF